MVEERITANQLISNFRTFALHWCRNCLPRGRIGKRSNFGEIKEAFRQVSLRQQSAASCGRPAPNSTNGRPFCAQLVDDYD